MDAQSLYGILANHRKILVTGPQRSGTTICSRILAAESGYRCVDEREFGIRDLAIFGRLIAEEERMVIQCPSLAHRIDEFGTPENLIVFMQRDPADIVASQRRIAWRSERFEKRMYRGKVRYMNHWFTPACVLKYMHWHFSQKDRVAAAVDLRYESLAGHRLWVEKDARSSFTAKQTGPSSPA